LRHSDLFRPFGMVLGGRFKADEMTLAIFFFFLLYITVKQITVIAVTVNIKKAPYEVL